MKRYFLISLAVLIVAFGVGAGIALLGNPELLTRQKAEVPRTVDALPAFSFEDLEGRRRKSDEWPDKVLVLNFWATWCPPCLAEIPGFIELQEKYASGNVQFIGIAVDEKELVVEFAESMGINYPILMGDIEAVDLSRLMGNRFGGLPFTVVVDREGAIEHRQPGEMRKEELELIIERLL